MAQFVEITSYIVSCRKCEKCGKHDYSFKPGDGRLVCKRCGEYSVLEVSAEAKKRLLESLRSGEGGRAKALSEENESLKRQVKELYEENERTRNAMKANLDNLLEARKTYDMVCEKCRRLTEDLEDQKRISKQEIAAIACEMNSKVAEIESASKKALDDERKLHDAEMRDIESRHLTEAAELKKNHSIELQHLIKSSDKDKARIGQLEESLAATESKNAYLESECRRSQSVQTREVVGMFLEFMSGIYNASIDMKDAEALSQMIQARADKVVMMAQSYGIDIHRTDRGAPVRDGRVDIDTKATESPELDGKVIKCRNFGCSFEGDVLTEIPEKVTVWNYVPPVTEEPVVEEKTTEGTEVPAAEITSSEELDGKETVPVSEPMENPQDAPTEAESSEIVVATDNGEMKSKEEGEA